MYLKDFNQFFSNFIVLVTIIISSIIMFIHLMEILNTFLRYFIFVNEHGYILNVQIMTWRCWISDLNRGGENYRTSVHLLKREIQQ